MNAAVRRQQRILTTYMPCSQRTVQRVRQRPIDDHPIRAYPTAASCENAVRKR
jgi:hypothetical protein